jgi:hypothetical protein
MSLWACSGDRNLISHISLRHSICWAPEASGGSRASIRLDTPIDSGTNGSLGAWAGGLTTTQVLSVNCERTSTTLAGPVALLLTRQRQSPTRLWPAEYLSLLDGRAEVWGYDRIETPSHLWGPKQARSRRPSAHVRRHKRRGECLIWDWIWRLDLVVGVGSGTRVPRD